MKSRGFSLWWLFLILTSWFLLCHAALCAVTLPPVALEELASITAPVVVRSSPCSATCGLGLRTEEVCLLAGDRRTEACKERKAECLVEWDCGLRPVTVMAGEARELDCLGEVMAAMGRFKFLFSWRYARGIVTTDNSFFSRYEVPRLDKLALEPVREMDAGTYRCDVKDSDYRMVKRVYFGVKVLPPKAIQLDYASALSRWDNQPTSGSNSTATPTILRPSLTLFQIVVYSLAISSGVTVLAFLALYCIFWKKSDGAGEPDTKAQCCQRSHHQFVCFLNYIGKLFSCRERERERERGPPL
ncbi:transmembrane protein 81 [Amia ocellicauda]|uniref:transmembrane protein 81 n=1 Tax=Amia ocellicauda TaxID=2972642 RepID=UPI003464CAB8